MKIKLCLIVLLHLFLITTIYSQAVHHYTPMPPCTTPWSDYNAHSSSQPTVCVKLLQDFIPNPHDREITVNLHFWVFKKSDGSGPWHAVTEDHADSLIKKLNIIYSSLQPPNEPVSPASAIISDTKIRFKKKLYDHFENTALFNNSANLNLGYVATDCNAINLLFCDIDSSIVNGGGALEYPGKYIFFPALTDSDAHVLRTLDDYRMLSAISHELGHTLGLNHTHDSQNDGYTSTKPEMGVNSCCDLLMADDVILEGDQAHGGTWGVDLGCTNVLWQYSNNIMGYATGCRNYLSPLQMALMHYHVRTDMKEVLTAQGYTAALVVDHHFDYTCGVTETWVGDRYMKGDIIIPNGNSLAIYCAVAMPYRGRIIVEPGGKLIINGSVTNISGLMWSGIQVGGVTTQDQSLGSSGFAAHQGILRMNTSHARISNAENGVKNYLTDTLGNVQWSNIGGIIIADAADFINNTRDVEFYPNTTAPSASRFSNCMFSTDSLMNHDTSGVSTPPLTRVSLWDTEGVKFYGCTFQYNAGSAYADHGTGISGDGEYLADMNGSTPCVFRSLRQGVYQLGVNPLYVPTITNSQFYDNTVDAVYMSGITGVVFNSNYVQPPIDVNSNGLYLQSCQQYNVRNNTFSVTTSTYKMSNGIYATGSKAGAHQIYRNVFNNLHNGIAAVDSNSSADLNTGLRMNCNDFSGVSNSWDISMLHHSALPTVKKDQSGPGSGALGAVRNIYGAGFLTGSSETQWYVYSTPSFNIIHPSNTQSFTQPLPQPDYSDAHVNVTNSGFSLNYSTHCLPSLSSSGDNNSGTLTVVQCIRNINTYLASLQASNPGDINHYEIEASLGTKLNLFLTDSLVQNNDSVINLLEGNTGRIANADILTVYAYFKKGDLTGAQSKINALSSSRSDWVALLNKQLTYLEHPDYLYDLKNRSTDLTFLTGYVSDENHDGFAPALALLRLHDDYNYNDPRPQPDDSDNSRHMQAQTNEAQDQPLGQFNLTVFPNPARDLVTVSYDNPGTVKPLQVVLRDALGQTVYENELHPADRLRISLTGLPGGVYLLSVYDRATSVKQAKVICIK